MPSRLTPEPPAGGRSSWSSLGPSRPTFYLTYPPSLRERLQDWLRLSLFALVPIWLAGGAVLWFVPTPALLWTLAVGAPLIALAARLATDLRSWPLVLGAAAALVALAVVWLAPPYLHTRSLERRFWDALLAGDMANTRPEFEPRLVGKVLPVYAADPRGPAAPPASVHPIYGRMPSSLRAESVGEAETLLVLHAPPDPAPARPGHLRTRALLWRVGRGFSIHVYGVPFERTFADEALLWATLAKLPRGEPPLVLALPRFARPARPSQDPAPRAVRKGKLLVLREGVSPDAMGFADISGAHWLLPPSIRAIRPDEVGTVARLNNPRGELRLEYVDWKGGTSVAGPMIFVTGEEDAARLLRQIPAE